MDTAVICHLAIGPSTATRPSATGAHGRDYQVWAIGVKDILRVRPLDLRRRVGTLPEAESEDLRDHDRTSHRTGCHKTAHRARCGLRHLASFPSRVSHLAASRPQHCNVVLQRGPWDATFPGVGWLRPGLGESRRGYRSEFASRGLGVRVPLAPPATTSSVSGGVVVPSG